MSFLEVSEDGKKISENVRELLLSNAYFPNNPLDAELFQYVLESERWRRETEGEKYEIGFVHRTIVNALKKRTSRGAMAGIVALSYIFIKSKNMKPSLERASKLASEVAYQNHDVIVLNGEQHKVRGKLNADQAAVKAIFREYRPVAHIWAAELCVDDDEARNGANFSPKALTKYARTALYFQLELEATTDTSTWNLLSIKEKFPKKLLRISFWNEKSGLFDRMEMAFEALVLKGGI